jgi:hypothetical protein
VGWWMVVGARAQACAYARVGLLTQYAKRRRHIVCLLSGSTTFSTFPHKRYDFHKNPLIIKRVFGFLYKFYLKYVSF